LLRSHPELLGLLTVTWFFNLLYGSVEVALPLHVTDDLHIVVGWGFSLLPFGFDVPTAVTVACFTLGGPIYGPFVALSVTLMQAKPPPQHLAAMLAARSAALLTAAPIGTALGGPLTMALGPRATFAGSGLATVALGAVAASCCWPGAETSGCAP
jgi:hypothetical protein